MTGKEKLINLVTGDDKTLLETLVIGLDCPEDIGLKNMAHCDSTCRECWKRAIDEEVESV